MPMNLGKHIYSAQQHIIIPEAQHAITIGFHLARSGFIFSGMLGMLTAIEFHHEMRLHAREIRDVAGDWILTAKLEILQLASTQMTP